jgi:hypothetical protein
MVSVLDSAYVLYYIYWPVHVEPSLYPRNETNLVPDLSDVLLNSVCKYFIENFCIFIKEISL